jgi:hypothetical protein
MVRLPEAITGVAAVPDDERDPAETEQTRQAYTVHGML